MSSTIKHPGVVTDYFTQKLQCHRIIGPLQPNLYTAVVHTNRFGVIPKRHQQGKWRLILDLSFPPNHSENTGIDRHLIELPPVCHSRQHGKNSVRRRPRLSNTPVHLQERPLLGRLWANHLYVNTVLPFGLCSVPKILCTVSDAVEWIIQKQGITSCLHYMDDFITLGAANSAQCNEILQLIIATC